ncbi:hypothetical protein EHI48_04495 [Rhizobium sp. WSM1325]|nr:hypothetical protein EHI43_23675 [Rhizobium leguminosarum]RWY77704.1 hypothetical protein EHI46_05500 [Rhizobium leguminosarum]RWY81985.1 hypothetical protein EHI48_04495 [Rhizobium leguminosarum]
MEAEAVIASDRSRKTERRASRPAAHLSAKPCRTSRQIIAEVSGMSPNICHVCIKTVHLSGEMPGRAEGVVHGTTSPLQPT